MLPLINLIHAAKEDIDYRLEASTLPITGIACDSRQVRPGFLFAALKGVKSDGSAFVTQAKAAGAIAVLCDKETAIAEDGLAVLRTGHPRRVLALMAAAFYGSQPACITAVTGTDGKTSTADFTRQLWTLLGDKAASMGTLGTIGQDGTLLYPGTHTTPDPVELARQLHALAQAGYTHLCMEASSHGLDQYRLDGVNIKAAAFTNLSRDHMDYHKTEEAYFAAKSRLFSEFPIEAAVINVDDPRAEALEAIALEKPIPYTVYGGAKSVNPSASQRLLIKHITPLPEGQKIVLTAVTGKKYLWGMMQGLEDKKFELSIPLIGAFQVFNMLAAAGLILATSKHKTEEVLQLLPQLKGVPGRLEQVARLANGATVYIDYAHTPMALANILKTLRPHTQNKLHVVFGCGGDRDAGKRPQMGKQASLLADAVIVTDDNPRSEDPALIRKAILAESPRAKEVADRREAIYVALKRLEAGDILVIAGKGHEKTQIVGDKTYPFDDAQVAREAAKELKLAA